jgi:hypothetical protein
MNPYFKEGVETEGIFEHDGLGDGTINKADWDEVYSENKPYIALYKRINSIFLLICINVI